MSTPRPHRSRALVALATLTAAVVTAGGLAGSALAMGHHETSHRTGQAGHAVATVRVSHQAAAADAAHGAEHATTVHATQARTAARARQLLVGTYQRHDGRLSHDPEPGTVSGASRPVIVGQPIVGQVLRAAVGHARGVHYRFQWLVGGRPVPGATGRTFKLTAADLGRSVAVRVTAVRHGVAHTATSRATRKVAPPLLQVRVAPSVRGLARVGHTLVAVPGAWRASHTTFTYRWYAGRTQIRHATSSHLSLTKALAGKAISVRVTAHHRGYSPTTVIARAAGTVRR